METDDGTSIAQVRDFAGTLAGTGQVGAIVGTVGDVTLGESWSLDRGLTAAADYHGTLGVATDPEGAVTILDLSASPAFDAFPGTFRVNHRQHVIMRLDQYVAARLVWPDDPQGVSLTLIESGVHGGSLAVPHVPDGVTCDFQTHDDDDALTPVADWALTPAEDGAHDLLTWPNPTLTGHAAWLAFEFNRNTRNDGRFALGIRDGLLCGLPRDPLAGSLIVGSAYFTDTAHPAVTAGALPLRYRPYAPADTLAYPNAWTLAVRLSAPAAGQRALLTLGTESAALLLATGENGNEIVLRRTDGTTAEELFRVTLTDAQSTMHTFGLVRDGRLRFTGGAGDPVHGDSHAAAVLFPGGNVELSRTYDGDFAWDEASTVIFPGPDYVSPDGNHKIYNCAQFGYRTYTVTWGPGSGVEGIFDAGVCHFSPSAEVVVKTPTAGKQTFKESARQLGYYHEQRDPKQELFTWHEYSRRTTSESQSDDCTPAAPVGTLRLVAGPSLTRGRGGEAATRRLTGPVVIENVRASGGRDCVPGNATDADQAAPDVWVPSAGANSMQLPSWVFSDATRAEAQGGEANADGAANGLFAQYAPTAGRLYLDCTQWSVSGDFQSQDWYLHGYKGTEGATPATSYDYFHATAFQIRLAANNRYNRDNVTLTLNHLPDAPIETFVVEDATPLGTDATPTLTLTLQGEAPLPVRTIITGARLDISNAGGKPALDLCPDGIPTPVHGGTGGRGALIVGDATIDWDFGAISSVPRLEVAEGRTLTLKGPQDFQASGTALVAQAGATLAQVGQDPLRGTDVELGESATLAFQAAGEEGVALSGELLLSGSGATLRGSAAEAGATPDLSATGGIRAAQSGAVLTVDAPNAWHLRTAKMTGEGFGLTKTGPGAVEIRDTVAPTLSSPVRVESGTLRVAKQSPAEGTPIGEHGLHVEAGATLAANDAHEGEGWLLADLPAGATLSGGGTVTGGLVRLANGATYRANLGEALTADGFVPADPDATADIRVDLPEGYGADTPFLVAERIEPDPTATPAAANVRRHLRAQRDGTIWDTVAAQRGGRTEYAARQASIIPTPELAATHPDLAGNLWETAIHDGLLDLSRFRNVPYVGDSRGLTRATTRTLSAAEIGHVLTCFSGVLAFSDGAAEDDVRYVDAQGLRVAYEFGISRVADVEVDGQPFTVVEIALRHALPETFPELAGQTLPEADFRDGVRVALATHDATGAKRLLGEADGVVEVTDLTGREPGVCPTPGRRFLRLPPGHATLQAIALPSATE